VPTAVCNNSGMRPQGDMKIYAMTCNCKIHTQQCDPCHRKPAGSSTGVESCMNTFRSTLAILHDEKQHIMHVCRLVLRVSTIKYAKDYVQHHRSWTDVCSPLLVSQTMPKRTLEPEVVDRCRMGFASGNRLE
jgi:hypothetical protein